MTLLFLVRYCVSFGSVVQKLRQEPRCDFECCLLVTLMMNGASADFSGLGQGEAFSCQIQNDTFEAPGVNSSIDDMGVMEIEMQESEKTNKATMEP